MPRACRFCWRGLPTRRCKPLRDALLYIEQPFDRRTTFDAPLDAAFLAHPAHHR